MRAQTIVVPWDYESVHGLCGEPVGITSDGRVVALERGYGETRTFRFIPMYEGGAVTNSARYLGCYKTDEYTIRFMFYIEE